MPITKRAVKKLIADRKRTLLHDIIRAKLSRTIKAFRKNPSKKTLPKVYKALDQSAKDKIIRQNKASRLKSRLAKLISKK